MKGNDNAPFQSLRLDYRGSTAISHAAVLLNDNFNAENGGVGQLNYTGLANFNISNVASGGAVDLLGNGFFDFYPGNGLYVDICGTSSACGVLTTKQTFGVGSYTITLGIAGNARANVTDAVNISFGTFSTSFPVTEFQVATEIENVTLSAPSPLTISDQGLLGPQIGDILLSVRIETTEVVPAPLIGRGLPALLAAAGVLFGASHLGRSKKARPSILT